MAIDVETLAAARTYTDDSLKGVGSVQGKNCTIQEITKEGTTNTVVFGWTDDEGNVSTSEMIVEDGKDGKDGADGKDGETGPKGDPGEKGETGEKGERGASPYELALATGFEGSEEDWLKSLTPTNIVTVSNSPFESHAGNFKVNEIGGVCEQFATTGAQLFDGMLEVGSLNPDGTNNATADAVRSVNYIAVTGGSTITLSNDKGYANYIYEYDEDKQLITYTTNATTATLVLNDNTNFIRLRSVTSKVENDLSVKYMLNAGTTALPWEPCTGGKPSPSPDYPQEIKKTVVSEIKTHGKNFLNPNNVIEGVNINTAGQIVGSEGYKVFYCQLPKGKYVFNSNSSGVYAFYTEKPVEGSISLDSSRTISTLIDNTYDNVWVAVRFSTDELEPQLEKGEVSTDYEPYTESTTKLSQPVELYGIGDVRDIIEDGKVVRRFAEVLLNGTDSEKWTLGGTESGQNLLIQYAVTDIKRSDKSLCNQFSHTDLYTSNNIIGYSTNSASNCIRFRPSDYESITLSDWKSRLQSNPMTVVYELAEPVIEPLPLIDQSALNSLKTFDNLTYVEFDSEVEPTFSGETALTTEGSHILESLAMSNALTLEYLDAATYICDNLP